MSNDIRIYKSNRNDRQEDDLKITAFVGRENGSVQFTIGDKYHCLTGDKIIDLVSCLMKRLNCSKGYSATEILKEKKVIYKKK